MSVSLDIVPLSDVLEVYGEPDSSSAYSLSGHISVTLEPSAFSFLESRRTANVLLESLELTFEGQTEIITPATSYSALRLCSITRQLAPEQGIELSNDGHEDATEPCRWNVVFNLPIPGWLPGSSTNGPEDVGTTYTLYATAKVVDIDTRESTWFSTLCSPFRSRRWTSEAAKPIVLKRLLQPPSSSQPIIYQNSFSVHYKVVNPEKENAIPAEVMEKLRIVVSVPSFCNMADPHVPLNIRFQAPGLAQEHAEGLKLKGFGVDIVQLETYRSRPSTHYTTRFPVPGPSMQPPEMYLRTCHPLGYGVESGLWTGSSEKDTAMERTFSLLPDSERYYRFESDNYIFKADDPETYYTLQSKISFCHFGARDGNDRWAGKPYIRPSQSGALFSVRHEAQLVLDCEYDLGEGKIATETLNITVPVRFAEFPALLPSRPASPALQLNSATPIMLPMSTAYALPVYSQLFYSNGDTKMDPTPLPLYSPRRSELPSYTEKEDEFGSESQPLLSTAY
ncbi:hypothetical protein C8J56DRAFT_791780 [Mycena floridula]|nr:hypothetical protein C8J56DRAFT_791780 [Mycena floridula]